MSQNYPKYFKWMEQFFKDHPEYQIVHSHIDAMSYLPLKAAKKAGVPVRIAHSHSTSIDRDFKYPLKQFYRYRIGSVLTDEFSCGKAAGEFLFRNDQFTLIPNAVEAECFYYKESISQEMRQVLEISEQTFVMGHVGRISYPKNHRFLIDIFKALHKIVPNSVLLIVGTGDMEDEIRNYAKESGVNDAIRFLGNQNDTANVHPKSLTHLQGQFTFHSASSNTSFPYFCDFIFLHFYYSSYYCLTFMNNFTGFPILLLIL